MKVSRNFFLNKKRLDVYTKNKKNNSVLDIIKKSEYDDFINLVAESYYSRLKSSKDNWKLEWENMCSREFDISSNQTSLNKKCLSLIKTQKDSTSFPPEIKSKNAAIKFIP